MSQPETHQPEEPQPQVQKPQKPVTKRKGKAKEKAKPVKVGPKLRARKSWIKIHRRRGEEARAKGDEEKAKEEEEKAKALEEELRSKGVI